MLGTRTLFVALMVTVLASTAHAGTTFVSPLEGAQVLGPMILEVTTTSANVARVDFYVDGALAGVARTPPYRMAWDFGTSLASRRITARVWAAGFSSYDETSILTAAPTASDVLNVDLVEVPLRVRSSRQLQASDIRLRENGVEQSVSEVLTARPAAHFAFIVDRSLSMGGGRLEAALRAVESGLQQLRAGDTASLVLFNHHVAKPRTLGRGQRVSPAAIAPSGGTSLRDALASVASRDRTYAIVITDGGDRNSALSEEAALRKISGARTTVNAVVLGDSHAHFLDRVAENTGGTVVAAKKGSVARAVQGILTDINSRYLLVYQSQGTKSGWRTIALKPSRRGIEIVSARKGYFAE